MGSSNKNIGEETSSEMPTVLGPVTGIAADTKVQEAAPPPTLPVALRLVTGKLVSMMLDTVVTLGIPDRLKDQREGLSASELAKLCDAHPDRLYRVMRALTNEGIFVEHDNQRFTLGEAGQYFCSDHPSSVAAMCKFVCGPFHSRSWLHLTTCVKTGERGSYHAFGCVNGFDYFSEDPEVRKIFQDFMTENSKSEAPSIIAAYKDDLPKFKTICDVGGGHGYLLSQLVLAAGDDCKGILFEVPVVADGAEAFLRENTKVAGRISIQSGDFFSDVPSNVDLFAMKHILFNHDDEKCIALLRHCRARLNPGGRILIMERIMTGPNEPSFAKVLDVEMLVMLTGRERTVDDFTKLLEHAGLRLSRIVPVAGPAQIIEAVPDS